MLSPSLLSLTLTVPILLVQAGGPPQPVPPKVPPTKLDSSHFPWTNPFHTNNTNTNTNSTTTNNDHSSNPPTTFLSLSPSCTATTTFPAYEYQLHDLHESEPHGLAPYAAALQPIFGGREYPGGWDGMNNHGYERTLLKMDYRDVPRLVRRWIAEQEKNNNNKKNKGLYAVFDRPKKAQRVTGTANLEEEQDEVEREWDAQRVVIFAPGAIYQNLPLWVAEGSECEDTLSNLEKYSPNPVADGVVGWPTDHTVPSRSQGQRKIDFTIKAQVLLQSAPLEQHSQDAEVDAEVDASSSSIKNEENVNKAEQQQDSTEQVYHHHHHHTDDVKDEL